MKNLLILFLLAALYSSAFTQNFEAELSGEGIRFPHLSSADRDQLNPIAGQCIFNTDEHAFECYFHANVGWVTLQSLLSDADRNTIAGTGAGGRISSGENNTYLGYGAVGAKNGNNNVFVGHNAGEEITTGNSNVYIGADSGSDADGDYNVFIGFQAGGNFNTSNKLVIETNPPSNSQNNHSGPLIFGDFLENYVTINNTLNVSEVLRLEPLQTEPSCDASSVGSIYMNAMDDKLKLCTLAGWKSIALE